MRADLLAGVISTAVSDALGKYGGQTELRAEMRHLADKGDRLQVAGLIDLGKLGESVAAQVIAVMEAAEPATAAEHATVEVESWDDI